MIKPPRSAQRQNIEGVYRVQLLENDLDEIEGQIEELRKEMNDRFDKLDDRQGKIMAACLAILTGLVVSIVMFALNLTTGA